MGPRKPSRTSFGSRPEWSIWAWEERTKSIEEGGTGMRRRFFRSLSPPPWNNPQSTRNRARPDCTRMQEPVTSLAAPKNVRVTLTGPASSGPRRRPR